jgi:Fanconi anemia group M protein
MQTCHPMDQLEDYIQDRFVKPNSIEAREYQVSLANQAKAENCLVVLPTGLGKTAVALQVIAEYLSKGTGGVLFWRQPEFWQTSTMSSSKKT